VEDLEKGGDVMVAKIYALIWLLVIGAAVVVGFTDNFNEVTVTVLGFIVSTLIFGGLIAVLPWWVDRQYSWKY
jgi:hypothetical protein